VASSVPVIDQALQGSRGPATFTVPAGQPAFVQFKLTSPDFPTDATLTFALLVEQSFDNGQTWEFWWDMPVSVGGQVGAPGKFGVPGDGLPYKTVSYDGQGRLARVTVTVNKPFTWGLTGNIL
jgi:hypothetical protein